MNRYTDAQIEDLKSRSPVPGLAGEMVRLRRKRGGGKGFTHAGPCPLCSRDPQAKDDVRFECDGYRWVCASCEKGGSVIDLVMARDGVRFLEACDRLGGVASDVRETPDTARRKARADFRSGKPCVVPSSFEGDAQLAAAYRDGWQREQKQEAANAQYRERERARLFHNFWRKAKRWPGTPVADYLKLRGLCAMADAHLRYFDKMPYFADGKEFDPLLVHQGPAMLAAFTGADGKFAGLHITWLDLARQKGKARIVHPHTGEELPSKKMRGSKSGGFIDLGCNAPDDRARRMFAGEGIETVLAVFTSLAQAGRVRLGDMFRASGDLGNLGGRALGTVPHPTLKGAAGRTRRVPGPDPDLTSPAMPVPDTIEELVILGDGDSEPFMTRCAVARAKARHAREGRIVRGVFADDGADFNDMVRNGADQQAARVSK